MSESLSTAFGLSALGYCKKNMADPLEEDTPRL